MHPSVIAGAMPAPLIGEPLGGCRLQSLPCKGRCRRRRRRGAAPCHAFTFTGQQCPHRPANLSAVAMLSGGRNRPPYNARQTAGETGNFAFAADVSFPGTHLWRIVGRAFTPAAVTSGCPAFPVQCPLCPAKLPAIAAFPGRCLASSRKAAGHRNACGAHQFFPLPSVCRQAPRQAKSPALQYKANGRQNREQNARGNVHFPGTHLWRIVGRAFTPAAVTSGCPSLPGPMPALPCKVSRNRSVSGPMLGIVPQNCRSPQCFGCTFTFPTAFRLPPCCPAGEIARPTIQGKRRAKLETLPLHLTFLFSAPVCGGL